MSDKNRTYSVHLFVSISGLIIWMHVCYKYCERILIKSTLLGSDRRSLSPTLSLTLPDLNLTIFPSIPCLVSGRRSEPIIILVKITSFQRSISNTNDYQRHKIGIRDKHTNTNTRSHDETKSTLFKANTQKCYDIHKINSVYIRSRCTVTKSAIRLDAFTGLPGARSEISGPNF